MQFWNFGEAQCLELDFVHEIGGILTEGDTVAEGADEDFLEQLLLQASMILRQCSSL